MPSRFHGWHCPHTTPPHSITISVPHLQRKDNKLEFNVPRSPLFPFRQHNNRQTGRASSNRPLAFHVQRWGVQWRAPMMRMEGAAAEAAGGGTESEEEEETVGGRSVVAVAVLPVVGREVRVEKGGGEGREWTGRCNRAVLFLMPSGSEGGGGSGVWGKGGAA